MGTKQEYTIENAEKKEEQPMGDVYDVYSKAISVQSKISGMSEDYTLTRYDTDIYNQKLPKFIREQRKILRIIKSYIIVPKRLLLKRYNNQQKVDIIYERLKEEYSIIEQLFLGELDECVIMGRTPKGEVIEALLKHGMNPESREAYDTEIEQPNIQSKLRERTPQ